MSSENPEQSLAKQIVVTYAILTKSHDSYCSDNEEIDHVRLYIRHRYHHVGCDGTMKDGTYATSVSGRTIVSKGSKCEGRSSLTYDFKVPDIDYDLYDDDLFSDRVHSSCILNQLANCNNRGKGLSETDFKSSDIPLVDYEEIRERMEKRGIINEEDEMVDFDHVLFEIPKGYKVVGCYTGQTKLEDLYYHYDTVGCCDSDRLGSGYCVAGQGSYYLPIYATLIRK